VVKLLQTNFVGVDEYDESDLINVSPNPFTHQLNAELFADFGEKAIVRLLDLSGKIYPQKTVQLGLGHNRINLEELIATAPGVYFLRITSAHSNRTLKVVRK